jgi:hypothetical protein
MRRSIHEKTMPSPPLPPTSPDALTVRQASVRSSKPTWLAIVIGLAGLVGGYRLQRVLNAIPDSNDDFIFF